MFKKPTISKLEIRITFLFKISAVALFLSYLPLNSCKVSENTTGQSLEIFEYRPRTMAITKEPLGETRGPKSLQKGLESLSMTKGFPSFYQAKYIRT